MFSSTHETSRQSITILDSSLDLIRTPPNDWGLNVSSDSITRAPYNFRTTARDMIPDPSVTHHEQILPLRIGVCTSSPPNLIGISAISYGEIRREIRIAGPIRGIRRKRRRATQVPHRWAGSRCAWQIER